MTRVLTVAFCREVRRSAQDGPRVAAARTPAAQVQTPAELEQYVPLADLEEEP